MKIRFAILTSLFMILCACGNPISIAETPSAKPTSSPESTSQVSTTPTGKRREEIEKIEIDNCNGKADIDQTAQRSQSLEISVSTEVAAKFGVEAVVKAEIESTIGASLGVKGETSKSIKLTAPPGTHMLFEIVWSDAEEVGVIVNYKGSGLPVEFRRYAPIGVTIKRQADLADCPKSQDSARPTSTNIPIAPTPIPVVAADTPIPPTDTPEPKPTGTSQESSENTVVVLANRVDNTYNWVGDGNPYITTKFVYEGDVAFIPTGNNVTVKDFGVIGYENNEIRYISLYVYLLKQEASLLLQVAMSDGWEHRWGFDGRQTYSGPYPWGRKGQRIDLPVKEWINIKLDLIDELGAKPGQKMTGFALSANDGNMVIDNIVLLGNQ